MENLVPTSKLRHFRKADEGQALVLTALALVVLMLMAGLGVDVGYFRYQKQQMQKAADAGAIAGASALIYAGNVTAAARNDTSANGFTNAVNGTSVTVNNPPLSGPFSGDHNYVEVIVSQPQPTFFMRVGGFNSVAVRGQAVASAAGNASGCIYALDPTDSQTFLVDGNVSISSACGIKVNSSNADALHENGGSGSIIASLIGVVGNYSGNNFSPTPVTGIAHFSDPLSGVAAPTPATGCASPSGHAYSPGTYCGGIHISGNGTYTFAPGLYTLLGGGFTASGTPTFTGNGVTFYNTFDATQAYGGISLHGTAGSTFSAPTTGPQAGILFFQDRRVPVGSASSDFGGTNGEVYTGAIYFPTTGISYKGTPSLDAATIMVGWTLDFRGNTSIIDYLLLPGGVGPIHSAVLVQ